MQAYWIKHYTAPVSVDPLNQMIYFNALPFILPHRSHYFSCIHMFGYLPGREDRQGENEELFNKLHLICSVYKQ